MSPGVERLDGDTGHCGAFCLGPSRVRISRRTEAGWVTGHDDAIGPRPTGSEIDGDELRGPRLPQKWATNCGRYFSWRLTRLDVAARGVYEVVAQFCQGGTGERYRATVEQIATGSATA